MFRKKGFTLIELLVVIAIIALLMAILMPALGRAKRQAMAIKGMANERQWGVYFQMFTDDHNGKFFAGWVQVDPQSTELWHTALRSYYPQDTDIRFCPVATKTNDHFDRQSTNFVGSVTRAWGFEHKPLWSEPPNIDYGSYGVNWWVSNPPLIDGVLHSEYRWRGVDVKGAGNIPLLLDSSYVDGAPLFNDEAPPVDGSFPYLNGMCHFCINRHDGAVNGLFLDFSVRRIQLKDLWFLKWHRGYDILNAGPSGDDWGWLK